MAAKPRTKPAMPYSLSLQDFSDRLAEKNGELLNGFLIGIQNGEVTVELEHGDEFIHAIIDEWCETEEPNRELHLRMISAIYIWMMLDELNAEEIASSEASQPANNNLREVSQQVVKTINLSMEVINTVRGIWRIANGKTS